MKNGHIFGFFAILLVGLILTGGCSVPGSAGSAPEAPATPVVTIAPPAAPVTTTTPQAVFENASVTPATMAATITPAEAPVTTTSPQFIHENVSVTPATPVATIAPAGTPVTTTSPQAVREIVFAQPTTEPTLVRTTRTYQYDEPSYPSFNLRPVESADGVAGTLVTRVTGCSAENLLVFIARAGTTASPIDDEYLLDRMAAGEETTDLLPVKVLPDGSSEPVRLAPDTYTAYLPTRDGDGIEENQTFRIGAGITTYISFTGASYLAPGSSCSSCSSCSRRR